MKIRKNDHTISVCITGDMDHFKIEIIEDCLVPLFNIYRKYDGYMTILVTAKAVPDCQLRAEYILRQWYETAVCGDIHQPFYGSMEEQIDRFKKAKQIYHETLGIIPVGFRASYMRYNQNTHRAGIITGFTCDNSCARNAYNAELSLLNRYFSGVSYPGKFN